MQTDHRAASYCIARTPSRMKAHNAKTWARIETELGSGGAGTYDRLVALSKGHESGTEGAPHPYQFVDYCIRSGWLKRAGS